MVESLEGPVGGRMGRREQTTWCDQSIRGGRGGRVCVRCGTGAGTCVVVGKDLGKGGVRGGGLCREDVEGRRCYEAEIARRKKGITVLI